MNTIIKSIAIVVIATGLSACAGMSSTEKGTLIGAGAGAVAGSVITGGNPIGIIGHEVGEDKDRANRRR